MNLVEYELGNICGMLAPVGSGGVAEQFIRALDLQFGGPEFNFPPWTPAGFVLGSPEFNSLRWLNTVLRAVSGNSRETARVLDKQTWRRKKQWCTKRRFLKIYSLKFYINIWQNFYFYRIWNNETFNMEVERTNLAVTHVIIKVQLIVILLII